MFEREVTIWSRVRHDNILALYGLTSLPGRAIEKQLFMVSVSPWSETSVYKGTLGIAVAGKRRHSYIL